MSAEKYKHLQLKFGLRAEEELRKRKIEMIHPSFRIIATASPPKRENPWLTHQVINLFHFFDLSSFSSFHLTNEKEAEENNFKHISSILKKTCPKLDFEVIEKLTKFYLVMQKLSEEETSSISNPISLRALIRVSTFCEKHGTQLLHSTICRSLMLGYITPITRDLIMTQLTNLSILPSPNEYTVELREISYQGENSLRIGDTVSPVFTPKVPALVPDIVFFNIPKHTQILELMLKDFLLGEHLLLIGSQVKPFFFFNFFFFIVI